MLYAVLSLLKPKSHDKVPPGASYFRLRHPVGLAIS
jgi:hypothetical protein